MEDDGVVAALTSFGDLWVAAAVYRNPKRSILADPETVLERVRSLGGGEPVIQLFDAEPIISLRQVHAAAVAAHLAFKAGTNIARRIEVEVLLRLAADTQIGRAIQKIGVRRDSRELGAAVMAKDRASAVRILEQVAALVGGEEISEEALGSEERVEKALEFYGIGGEEVETVQAGSRREAALLLVLERMAILDVER